MTRASIAALLLFSSLAHGADKISVGFTEDRKSKLNDPFFTGHRKSVSDAEAKNVEAGGIIESARLTFQKYNNRVRVPGFISASPIPQVGRIIGPVFANLGYRMGDRVYIRWSGAPLPKAGDRFATFTPAVVLQSLNDPTQFDVFDMPGPTTKLPPEQRLAGYFYETSGRIKVLKVQNGVVNAMVEQLTGHLGVGDEVMEMTPLLDNITPINSGIQISAAVVCGSPPKRISTTKRSFLYLNRGSRDGIRVGRVFESIENVRVDEAVGGSAPEVSNGEAIVVHVTDSYSTAMIIKQFDVVRIGSLLRTKQEEAPVARHAPFQGYENDTKKDEQGAGLPTVPTAENFPGKADESLPEPRKRPSGPPLSELDELEGRLNLKGLSPQEKGRLDRLSRQEKVGAGNTDEGEELAETPGAPTVDNSFKEGKKSAKKDTSKKKSKSAKDEEELNLLMMQN